jgi:hypothetical protein
MTGKQQFPKLDFEPAVPTRDALHAYAHVLGAWLKTSRPKRKHWWHASLRPSLQGLTSGVVNAQIDFELELNLRDSLFSAHTSEGAQSSEGLNGQSAADFAQAVNDFLIDNGVDKGDAPSGEPRSRERFAGYSADHANNLGHALAAVNASMAEFRAGIKEETSPIQLWPHHFDLSMLWLPGEKIEGQDPDNEEYSDKQMNFGFTFGDAGIPEPYFYVTAYPLPDAFPGMQLPAGTEWQTEGFNGAVLLYKTLIESGDPHGYLLDLWARLLSAGRDRMLSE